MKIVINECYGGFGLNDEAMREYKHRAGITDEYYSYDIARDCPHLVAMVEELGHKIETNFSRLKIVNIPDDVKWQIEEYDGMEWIAEQHRTWE
jgi:hypothetical protein